MFYKKRTNIFAIIEIVSIFMLIIALFFTNNLHAQEIEVGLGVSHYKDRGDGYWVQEGFQHDMKMTSAAVEIGLSSNVIQVGRYGADLGVDWNYLGVVHTQAIATALDANYSAQTRKCVGKCWVLSNFTGSGHDQGVSLTLRPYVTFGTWELGLEVGTYVHKPLWSETVYNFHDTEFSPLKTISVNNQNKWQIDSVVGLTASYKSYVVKYQFFRNQSYATDAFGAIWTNSHVVSLNYKF